MIRTRPLRASEFDDLPYFHPLNQIGAAAGALVSNLLSNVEQLLDGIGDDSRQVGRDLRAFYVAAQTAARDVARATPRFARISRDLLHTAAGYRVHASLRASAAGEVLGPEISAAMLERLHRESAERLYTLCVDLRGGVLKLGQFISTRRDLLPNAWVESLSRLQDRVPAVAADAIIDRIESDLRQPLTQLFVSFERDCIAAASLAQVHAAQLPDGTPVAVKVQVPAIEEIIDTDIAALQIIVPMIKDLLPTTDLDTVMSELMRALRRELDYRAEARNAIDFAACYADDPDVIIPAIHAEHSGGRVLTLEFIAGERLTDYLDDCERRGTPGESDRDRIMTILIRNFCEQVLVHGLFHADPHPGNFLVTSSADGPRLAILDFGNVQRFSPERRRSYAELGLAILSRNSARMAELLSELGFRSRDRDGASLAAFAELLLEPFRADVDPFAIDAEKRIAQVLELTRDNPVVQIPADFVQLGRVFASLGGLLMRYRPNVDLFQQLMAAMVRI